MNAPARPSAPSTTARRAPQAIHEGFLAHRRYRWAWIAALLAGSSVLLYALDDPWPRPNGGTALGYALGTLSAGLIVWLSLLGIRKRRFTDGPWSLKAWVSAHVWLGLALAIIATLHAGFQFGWNVHTLAWALMMGVILSGVWGVVLYQRLPRQLSDNRATASERAMAAALAESDRALEAAARPLGDREAALVRDALATPAVGRSLGSRLAGRVPRCGTAAALRALPEGDPELAPLRDLLAARSVLLARIRTNARLKTWLQVWLLVHVPLTVALLAALLAHIVSVFFYW
ncbi:hypothetical protein [Thermaurantiacus tibetensis]|uniref:hypothetical protein n=1 Tax=Thermaurantiacus tibetensis TaxID=2759035 RepID=UPI002E2A6B17|nr:hypothetical protein [Thermaurantiacus tibetensis]